jgi:hypothetical protein
MTNEVEDTSRKVQEAQAALIAANKANADAKRRAQAGKHVRDMSPAELKADRRRRGLSNNY